uniref:Uncharacterized protein n=1 Tax=Anopheles culicifacies TaxID=139723 RepID=A0A182LVD0_9DIPT
MVQTVKVQAQMQALLHNEHLGMRNGMLFPPRTESDRSRQCTPVVEQSSSDVIGPLAFGHSFARLPKRLGKSSSRLPNYPIAREGKTESRFVMNLKSHLNYVIVGFFLRYLWVHNDVAE